MPGFSRLTVQVQEHAPRVLQQLNSLRRDGILCDCVLRVKDKEFPVHRSFLAACSPYFQALFTSQMKESERSLIDIGGVSAETFELLLDFIYSGKVNLCEENIIKVFPAAQLFQLEILVHICSDYFVNQLCVSNCLGIWRFASTYSHPLLKKAAWSFIARYFLEMANCEEFLQLSKVELCTILSSGDLEINSEMDVYRAVLAWLLHDISARKQEITNVISCVRFPLLSVPTLSSLSYNIATDDQLLLGDTSIRDIVTQAKNAQRLRSTKSRQKIAAFKKQSLTRRKSSTVVSVVGGYSGDFVRCCETYDVKSDSWQPNDLDLPSDKHFHWIGTIGMRVYALGGDTMASINQVMSSFTTTAAEFLQSTAFATGWECEAALPHDCSNMQICTMNECIYLCGEAAVDDNPVYGISCYNPSPGTWEFLAALPKSRVLGGFTGYNGKLYLIGGMDTSSGMVVTCLDSYDPAAKQWEALPSCASGRYHVGVAVLNDCLYLIGGIGDEGGQFNIQLKTVECFSFKTSEWSNVASLSLPRAGMAVCVCSGRLFVAGGETTSSLHSTSVEVFDPEVGKWVPAAELCNARIYPNAFVS